ncbi:MAG: enoyl-CoA hydratase-related protein [Actinomycetota bacterium]|nr:enoyl-CoA hydratase-related protein [Actinomycetota bacterium]
MLRIDDHDGVRVLRLERPERLNAFDHVQYGEMADALLAADADTGVHVVVLTGTGRAFCAGADLTSIQDPALAVQYQPQFDRMLDALAAISIPVVAAVNGLAVGVGVTLLLQCDLVLADPEARFRTPFAALGTAPEAGSSLLLPQRVGAQLANWMLLTGEWVDAQRALQAGLVAAISQPGAVQEEAIAVAQRIAAHAPQAVAVAKRLVAHGRADLVRAARDREVEAARRLHIDGVTGWQIGS